MSDSPRYGKQTLSSVVPCWVGSSIFLNSSARALLSSFVGMVKLRVHSVSYGSSPALAVPAKFLVFGAFSKCWTFIKPIFLL